MKCTVSDFKTGEIIDSNKPISGEPVDWGDKEVPYLPPPGDEPPTIGTSLVVE